MLILVASIASVVQTLAATRVRAVPKSRWRALRSERYPGVTPRQRLLTSSPGLAILLVLECAKGTGAARVAPVLDMPAPVASSWLADLARRRLAAQSSGYWSPTLDGWKALDRLVGSRP